MYQGNLIETGDNLSGHQQLQDARLYFRGVRVDNIDSAMALASVEGFVRGTEENTPRTVYFTNVHTIHLAQSDKTFLRHVNDADLVLPDGSGLMTAGRVLGNPIVENLNGTDFIPRVLRYASEAGWSVYLFGAQPHVVERCSLQLRTLHPSLNIVGHHHGHVEQGQEEAVIADINAKAPDILLVALGSPMQELWIARNTPNLRVRVCFAVGGLFDFLSGHHKRAPQWIRKIGAESVYRFTKDPRSKWPRVFVEQPFFLLLVFAAKVFPWYTPSFLSRSYDD